MAMLKYKRRLTDAEPIETWLGFGNSKNIEELIKFNIAASGESFINSIYDEGADSGWVEATSEEWAKAIYQDVTNWVVRADGQGRGPLLRFGGKEAIMKLIDEYLENYKPRQEAIDEALAEASKTEVNVEIPAEVKAEDAKAEYVDTFLKERIYYLVGRDLYSATVGTRSFQGETIQDVKKFILKEKSGARAEDAKKVKETRIIPSGRDIEACKQDINKLREQLSRDRFKKEFGEGEVHKLKQKYNFPADSKGGKEIQNMIDEFEGFIHDSCARLNDGESEWEIVITPIGKAPTNLYTILRGEKIIEQFASIDPKVANRRFAEVKQKHGVREAEDARQNSRATLLSRIEKLRERRARGKIDSEQYYYDLERYEEELRDLDRAGL